MKTGETDFIQITGIGGEGTDTAVGRPGGRPLPDILPALGLSDVVIFPKIVAPLVVESGPSVQLVDDVVRGNRLLLLVLQRRPEVQEPAAEDLHEHGCLARVLKMVKFPDQTLRILIEGLYRVHLTGFEPPSPYLRAHYEIQRDVTNESLEIAALARTAVQKFEEILKSLPGTQEQVRVALLNTKAPGAIADLIASTLNLPLDDRQSLLKECDVRVRLRHLLPLIERELEMSTLNTKIQSEVAGTLARSQRENYLREQLRAIQRELGEGDPAMSEVGQLRSEVSQADLPDEVRQVATKELDRLAQMPPAVAEYTIGRNYLDWILHLPWRQSTQDKLDLVEAERLLDQQHHGLRKIKDRLLEYLAVIKLRQNLRGPILCLAGPPGVGKTSLGRSIATALGRKFARISLGGVNDEAEIRGHRRTYVGAMPGRIIQALRRVEARNPVLLLDEIDKLGTGGRGDPASALLEVLDPEQNTSFTDHYLDLPFDLSQVLFITTANWTETINPALFDRLETIQLPSYTEEEKLMIAREHLLPRQLAEHGLKKGEVRIPDGVLRKVITEYTREAGVRELERTLAALARKGARQRAVTSGRAKAFAVTASQLPDLLGPPRHQATSAEKFRVAGIALGLAWTPVGGDILFIEATRMPGRGQLILTGSLGEVMKESAQAALSYLRSQQSALGLDGEDFSKLDLHIHVPAGATPKDGPSAGVTLVIAMASVLTRRRVRPDLAMTGEISLRGRVLRIGGVREKALAALRSGIRHVLLPAQNRSDWLELEQEVPDVHKRLQPHFVENISEAIDFALLPR